MKKVFRSWQTVVLVTLMAGAVAFVIGTLMTPQYRAVSRILVIEKGSNEKQDHQAPYISQVLAAVIHSSMFLTDVHNSPFEVKRALPGDLVQSQQQLTNSVTITAEPNIGIIEMRVLQPSKKLAEDLSHALIWTLISTHQKYHGGGDQIEVKLIDGPSISSKPVRPNIYLFCLIGLGVGLILAWIIVRREDGLIDQTPKPLTGSKGSVIWKSQNFSQLKAPTLDRYRKDEVYPIPNRGQQDTPKPSNSRMEMDRNTDKATMAQPSTEPVPKIPVADPKEYVKKVEGPLFRLSHRPILEEKRPIPENLPVFDSERDTPWDTPVDRTKPSQQAKPSDERIMPQARKAASEKKSGPSGPLKVSDEEIKDRLNRLLKGEL